MNQEFLLALRQMHQDFLDLIAKYETYDPFEEKTAASPEGVDMELHNNLNRFGNPNNGKLIPQIGEYGKLGFSITIQMRGPNG